MTPAVTHPLVSAYLRDLELLLHGIDPGERAEVLAGVHEHLDARLPPGAADDDVRAVLAELGSPQSVADEAYAGRSPSTATAPAARPRPGVVSRGWVPVAVGLLLGLALLFVTFMLSAGSGYSTSGSESTDSAGNVTQGPLEIQYDGAFPGVTLMVLLATAVVWFPPLFLCLASPLWSAREKVLTAVAMPATAIVLTGLPDLGWALTKAELGINVGAWMGLAIALAGGGFLLVRICRAGTRRAQALETGALR